MIYLGWFVVFDGFTSFHGDAGSYLLIARKWSPWLAPGFAEISTWPLQSYPPIYPLLLAFSSGSQSLWGAHLLTLLCLGAALALFFRYHCSPISPLLGLMIAALFLLLPGTLYTSFGIMSENLFLALVLLVLGLAHGKDESPGLWISLYVCLALAILTRSAGLALIPALIMIRPGKYTISYCFCSLLTLLVWNQISPLAHLPGYLDFLKDLSLADHFQFVRLNISQLPLAWQTYLAGPLQSLPLATASWLSFAIVLFFTMSRASHGHLEALFCLCFFLVLLLWPFPTNYRFIQPVVLILLLQPAAALGKRSWPVYLLIALPLFAAQSELWQRYWKADPDQRHSRDYYLLEDQTEARSRAAGYAEVQIQMIASASLIEPDAVVAAVKPAYYALLSQRAAVPLRADITRSSACKLQLDGVEYALLTKITSGYNEEGLSLEPRLLPYVHPLAQLVVDREPGAKVLRLKKDLNCTSY
jgi:hypothetical protein